MPIPENIRDREYAKFVECDGNTAVRIAGCNLSGTFTPRGLSVDHKNTMMEVSTIATPLPSVPLVERNSLSIRNLSATEILYIGKSDVVADENIGTTAGWQIGPNETYNVDITDSIIIYGRVASGTIKVQVKELA